MSDVEVMIAPNVIEYPFRRTTGPVIGAFFTALREGFVVGVRGSDGRVIVPPAEYDPVTAEELTEIVEVGDAGEVVSWAWVAESLDGHPFDRPFAFALVKLDGADTPMLHAVDVAAAEQMRTGMRVAARWRPARPGADDEVAEGVRYREGHIADIECFVPEGDR
ncbi:MAG: OB-fold domain-containing protein [Acidimicrobiales bacterium]|nr:OB-fold domain-containing protein [Acidimicrobiales bacterium]